jgi:hypothetical protein
MGSLSLRPGDSLTVPRTALSVVLANAPGPVTKLTAPAHPGMLGDFAVRIWLTDEFSATFMLSVRL